MNFLTNPENYYGALPDKEKAEKLLAAHLDLQKPQGALEYLEKHVSRVEEYYKVLSDDDRSIWTILQGLKTRKLFTNTTKALRVIMVFHAQDKDVLEQMENRIKESMGEPGLEDHYNYLLQIVSELR